MRRLSLLLMTCTLSGCGADPGDGNDATGGLVIHVEHETKAGWQSVF